MGTRLSLLLIVFGILAGPALAVEGLVTKKSPHSVATTVDRLEEALRDGGVTVAARIDHAAAAEKAGLELRPTTLLIFGNPKAGTPLMQAAQTIGIDLPMKALVWEDEKGQVWLAFVSPSLIASRHGISASSGPVEALTKALERFTDAAVKP